MNSSTLCLLLVVLFGFQHSILLATDKTSPHQPSPVEREAEKLPEIEAAELESGSGNEALERHFSRILNAMTCAEEAKEIEALVNWVETRKPQSISISLGHRCPPLTDEELLALSSFPKAKILLSGRAGGPVIAWLAVELENSKNILRLLPLAVPTEGGIPMSE